MDKLVDVLYYIVILAITLFIEYGVLSPFVQEFVDMGAQDITDPFYRYLYESMFHIIDIIGIYTTITGILYYFKRKFK